MNFEQMKAKYAAKTVSTTTAVNTTAGKIDAAVKSTALKTKDVAIKTGNGFVGALPVSTRKHNDFAASINAELNGVNRRIDRHDLLLEVLAENTGTVLPSNEVLDAYLDQQAAAQVPTPPAEEVVAGIVAKVLASLGMAPAPAATDAAPTESVLSPEVTAALMEQRKNAPTIAEQDAAAQGAAQQADAEAKIKADADLKKEVRRLAALEKRAKGFLEGELADYVAPEDKLSEEDLKAQDKDEYLKEGPVKEEVPAEEGETKKIKRKRPKGGMGRQEPLAAE